MITLVCLSLQGNADEELSARDRDCTEGKGNEQN